MDILIVPMEMMNYLVHGVHNSITRLAVQWENSPVQMNKYAVFMEKIVAKFIRRRKVSVITKKIYGFVI
jgi:hypothetical protein